jgi:hypothetical protein
VRPPCRQFNAPPFASLVLLSATFRRLQPIEELKKSRPRDPVQCDMKTTSSSEHPEVLVPSCRGRGGRHRKCSSASSGTESELASKTHSKAVRDDARVVRHSRLHTCRFNFCDPQRKFPALALRESLWMPGTPCRPCSRRQRAQTTATVSKFSRARANTADQAVRGCQVAGLLTTRHHDVERRLHGCKTSMHGPCCNARSLVMQKNRNTDSKRNGVRLRVGGVLGQAGVPAWACHHCACCRSAAILCLVVYWLRQNDCLLGQGETPCHRSLGGTSDARMSAGSCFSHALHVHYTCRFLATLALLPQRGWSESW